MASLRGAFYMILFLVRIFGAPGVLLKPKPAQFRRHGHAAGADVKVFVSDFFDGFPEDAPSLSSLNLTMDSIYGKEHCVGDFDFVSRAQDAPTRLCRYDQAEEAKTMAIRPDFEFDQYALEKVMLAKWQESPHRCSAGPECGDIAVVPSLTFHRMVRLGFAWWVFHPENGGGWSDARRYWDSVRAKFHRPEKHFTPIVVIHTSFVWERANDVFLRALAEQPPSFISRVALLGLESNINIALESDLHWQGGPFMMALPYPTSLLDSVDFAQDAGKYVASKPRDVLVSMIGSKTKGDGKEHIRDKIWDMMKPSPSVTLAVRAVDLEDVGESEDGGVNNDETLLRCREGAPEGANCGLGEGLDFNLWSVTVNSAFCMEPAGDTPTRSHLYIAVLMGCIPVIFDGGHNAYDPSIPTWWAWRKNERRSRSPERTLSRDGSGFRNGVLNYEDFALVFNASDVLENKVDLMQELESIPREKPELFNSLRNKLAQVAPLMRYSKEPCSADDWSSTGSSECRDAFTVAQQQLVQLATRS